MIARWERVGDPSDVARVEIDESVHPWGPDGGIWAPTDIAGGKGPLFADPGRFRARYCGGSPILMQGRSPIGEANERFPENYYALTAAGLPATMEACYDLALTTPRGTGLYARRRQPAESPKPQPPEKPVPPKPQPQPQPAGRSSLEVRVEELRYVGRVLLPVLMTLNESRTLAAINDSLTQVAWPYSRHFYIAALRLYRALIDHLERR